MLAHYDPVGKRTAVVTTVQLSLYGDDRTASTIGGEFTERFSRTALSADGQQLAIAGDVGTLSDGNGADQPIASLLGDRLVDVGDVGEHGAELHAAEVCAAGPGFDLRDAQQRLERFDNGVELLERLLDLRAERGSVIGVAQR